jgi:hypothetical protein
MKTGVGKSALTIRFMENRFVEDYDPTIEGMYAERRQKQLNHKRALVTGGCWGRPVGYRGRTNVRVVGGLTRLVRATHVCACLIASSSANLRPRNPF